MLGELFDPKADLLIHERLRPHWSQAGAIVFVTFRTVDSIPKEVLQRWEREKQDWVERILHRRVSRGSLREPTPPQAEAAEAADAAKTSDAAVAAASAPDKLPSAPALVRGANHDFPHWSKLLPMLTDKQRHEFHFQFNRCRETKLDECLGACVLKRPELAKIVSDSLPHFDGDRYRMGDFVVMPNHVHLLAAFATQEIMERQFDSWLHYTAFRINPLIGSKNHFWQQEPFDRLVRSVEQFEYLRNYIAQNPAKAGLKPGEFYYRCYEEKLIVVDRSAIQRGDR
jgi:type I restriction enzyme R subunit